MDQNTNSIDFQNHNAMFYSKWIEFDDYVAYLNGFNYVDDVSLYHSPVWLKLIENSFGIEFKAISTFDQSNELVAITPFMIIIKGPFKLLGSPLRGLNTNFAGPLLSKKISTNEKLSIISSQHELAIKKASYVEWGLRINDAETPQYFEKLSLLGYESVKRRTSIIDLSVEEEVIWKKFKGRARTSIRKALNSNVLVKKIDPTDKWIKKYYVMLNSTFNKQNKANPHPLKFFKNIRELVGANKAFFLSAEIEGRLIAAAIFLIDDNNLLYLSGSANNDGMKFSASSLIQWKAICIAKNLGAIYYDLNGLGVPSIDKFKNSFGGHESINYRWILKGKFYKLIEPLALWLSNKGIIKIG